MKTEFQVSDHGAGKFSVQLFDTDTRELLADRGIVRDTQGWRVVDQTYSEPQFETVRAAAEHYAFVFHNGRIV